MNETRLYLLEWQSVDFKKMFKFSNIFKYRSFFGYLKKLFPTCEDTIHSVIYKIV